MAQKLNSTIGSVEPDKLFAGPHDYVVTRNEILASGNNLPRGALLTYDTATKKVKGISATTEDVYGVLADPVDATSADSGCVVYLTGRFNPEALSTTKPSAGEAPAVDDFMLSARKVGIFFASKPY